jgi:hypothetical protein
MADDDATWPALPTETEIYILPSGEIVVADLPAELAAYLTQVLPNTANRAAEDEQTPYVTEQQHPTDPA